MRLARKLFLLAGTVITALALTASTATAQEEPVEVSGEVSGDHCDEVTIVGHVVSGGCLVEFESTEHIPLHAYIPQKVTLSNCLIHLTAHIGEDGNGYITQAVFAPENPPTNPPCTRRPCNEDASQTDAMIPWPLNIHEHMPSSEGEEISAAFCLILASAPEGSAGTQCEVHLEWVELNDHDYEIGHHPSEKFCEFGPGFPVSIEDAHFRYEEGSEIIEVNHL